QRRLQVRYSGEKDRIALMVMIRLEDEFVPVMQVRAKLEKAVQCRGIIAGTGQRPAKELEPVILTRHQDVRRVENDVIAGQVGQQRWKEPDVPDFALLSTITRGRVTDKFGVRDEFTQSDVLAVHADMLVDAHAGSSHLLQGVKFRSLDMIPSCGERLLRGYGETEAEVTARVVDDFCVQFLTYFRQGFRAMGR